MSASVQRFLSQFASLAGIRWVAIVDAQGCVIAAGRNGESLVEHPALLLSRVQLGDLGAVVIAALRERRARVELMLPGDEDVADLRIESMPGGYALAVASDRYRTAMWNDARVRRAANVLRRAMRPASPAAPPPPSSNGGTSGAPASAVLFAHRPPRAWG